MFAGVYFGQIYAGGLSDDNDNLDRAFAHSITTVSVDKDL